MKIEGIYVPIITPFQNDLSIDYDNMHQIEAFHEGRFFDYLIPNDRKCR